MKLRMILVVCLCSPFGCMGTARAADAIYPGANTTGYESPSGWTFTFSMYGWFAGIEGDVGGGVGPRTSMPASTTSCPTWTSP
nr:hypothetical protein [Rhizobium sp. T1473]